MDDKYAKEIAKELRLIRIALQVNNQSVDEGAKKEFDHLIDLKARAFEEKPVAGEKVTIK